MFIILASEQECFEKQFWSCIVSPIVVSWTFFSSSFLLRSGFDIRKLLLPTFLSTSASRQTIKNCKSRYNYFGLTALSGLIYRYNVVIRTLFSQLPSVDEQLGRYPVVCSTKNQYFRTYLDYSPCGTTISASFGAMMRCQWCQWCQCNSVKMQIQWAPKISIN